MNILQEGNPHPKFFFPEAIAVEFPKTIQTPRARAVRRLPFLSVVFYQEQDGTYVYLPIEPTDQLVEAACLREDYHVPVFCVDRDTIGVSFITGVRTLKMSWEIHLNILKRSYKQKRATPFHFQITPFRAVVH